MSRNLPYGYDAPEPEPEEDHSHEFSVVAEMPDYINCETLTAAVTVVADVDIRTPELWLGAMVMKEQNGAVHAPAFESSLVSATIVDAGALRIAGVQFVPEDYATHDGVTNTVVEHEPFSHITEVEGVAVIMDELL
jgi:hypothetical protein